ncbi:hypothetical protein HaLaN_30334 [Haematococcus lacustris]|uniref:Uncharacterized protein n=1 Tax=Haematococcus lacustris TaxID=44745 RepID=A0A6A0AHJ2_HAELA|nr:hypothetical protein HaLaN_30334 [Haematococcus lacustris]
MGMASKGFVMEGLIHTPLAPSTTDDPHLLAHDYMYNCLMSMSCSASK